LGSAPPPARQPPLFKVPQYQLVHPAEFAVYAVLGAAGGLVSVAFTKLLLAMRERFLRFPQKTLWFQPVAGGLLVGLLGWFVPPSSGCRLSIRRLCLKWKLALKLMALLVVLKLIAVTTSYASGNAGGIFGPALFIGAMLGGSVGILAHRLFPAYTATSGAYALVGMGAAFAGIVRAPNDVSTDDFRNDPGLRSHRSADDFELGQPFHFIATPEAADLRGPYHTGWHTPALGRATARSATGNPSHARRHRVATGRYHGSGSFGTGSLQWIPNLAGG
jgi:hypothetical protein